MATRYILDGSCRLVMFGSEAVVESARGPLRILDLAPGQSSVLTLLADAPRTRAELANAAEADGRTTAAWTHMIIDRLVDLGLVARVIGSPMLVSVTVTGSGPPTPTYDVPTEAIVRMDRLAYLHAVDGVLVLESPRAFARVTLHDARVAMVIGLLATGSTARDVAAGAGLTVDDVSRLAALLCSEGFAGAVSTDVVSNRADECDEWSFHDALFHVRSRSGRHGAAYGATYARAGERRPLPAARSRLDGPVVELATADLDVAARSDPPFGAVLEARQSWRVPGPRPLSAAELGEFLYRSARIRGRRGTEHEEVSNRPYPGGGADYELEIYVLAHRVDGLVRGLYSYDPLDHVLVRISEWSDGLDRLAGDVAGKTVVGEIPDAALLLTARMKRLTYKYESIPYAIALKDVGALYGTWYLTATAMGLAPCAIGGGDSELLSAITGISPFEEPRVGEFILNTPHPDEVRGPLPPSRVNRPARSADE